MRLFFGLPLSDQVRTQISEYMDRLRNVLPHKKIRWIRTENLHVTLRFLGDIAPPTFEKLKGWTAATGAGPSIPVTLGPLDSFPRILFLQVTPARHILDVYRRLENYLSQIGIETESRPYVPHLTLARMEPERRNDPGVMNPKGFRILEVLNKIVLYESKLTSKGPIYTPISTSTPAGSSRT